MKMYDSLFYYSTDAIKLLQSAQQKTEKIYVSGEDAELRIVKAREKDSGE